MALKALLDVFFRLEILIFSPVMGGEEARSVEARSVEAFPHLQEHRSIPEAEGSPSVVVLCKRAPVRWADNVTLLLPPKDLMFGLADLFVRCRELVLTKDFDYGRGIFNLFVQFPPPSLPTLTRPICTLF